MFDLAPRERLERVLAKEDVDRAPVICTGGMLNAAVVGVMSEDDAPKLPQAHFSAESMARLAERVRTATGFENLGVPFCMTVEPEVLGSRIDPGSLSCEPKIAAEAYASSSDVEVHNIRRLMQSGRIGTVIQAAHHLKARNPDVPVIATLSGPISTAASVVDPLSFLKELRTKPRDAHRVLDYITELLVAYAQEVARNGADVIAIGDPTATGEILGPTIFGTFAVRYLNILCDAVHAAGKPVIVHICGDMSRSRHYLVALHADAISVDAKVSLVRLKEDYPQINAMGNLSTALLEFGDSDKVWRSAERLARDGVDIIAPACGLSTSTGLDNIRAMTDAVKTVRHS